MEDSLDKFLFGNRSEADLEGSAVQWQLVEQSLGASLNAAVQDRRLLVLYALECSGHGDMLTADEQRDLAQVRDQLREAVETHPGLESVIDCVDLETKAFDDCWEEQVSPRRARIRPLSRVWRVAAAVMTIGLAGLFAYYVQKGTDSENAPVAVIAPSSSLQLLPDGSEVLLIDSPSLSYDADAFDRRVYLDGQAFFDVAHGEDPFVVTTPNAVATVLGTRFGIKTMDEVTEIVLESGSVEIASEGLSSGKVVLSPGQMSRVEGGNAPTMPATVDITAELGWTGMLFFQASPMSEVAARLEEVFGVTIDVDAILGAEAVSGTFYRHEGTDQILSVLAATLGAQVVEIGTDQFEVVGLP